MEMEGVLAEQPVERSIAGRILVRRAAVCVRSVVCVGYVWMGIGRLAGGCDWLGWWIVRVENETDDWRTWNEAK